MDASGVKGVYALHEELERAKSGLKTVDETLKKLIGRDPSDPRPIGQRRLSRGGLSDGRSPGLQQGRGAARIFAVARRDSEPGPPAKRPAVFSRLGGRRPYSIGGRQDSEDDEDASLNISVHSSVVATATEPQNRSDSIEMQKQDERGKARNKRMFGLLMGTLQKFKTEESQHGEKEKRRKEAERRVEQKAREEKEVVRQERQALFQERKRKQEQLRNLEHKLELVDIHEQWEVQTRQLMRFIRTKSKPPIFFLPKEHTSTTTRKLAETTDLLEQIIADRRKQLEEEIEDLMTKDDDMDMSKKTDDINKTKIDNLPDDSVNYDDDDVEMAELGEGNVGLGLCDEEGIRGDEAMVEDATMEGKEETGEVFTDGVTEDKENKKETPPIKESTNELSKDTEKDSRRDRSQSERRRHTSRDRSRRSRDRSRRSSDRSRRSRDRSHRHKERSSRRDRRDSDRTKDKTAGDASQKSSDGHRVRNRSGSEHEKEHGKGDEKEHGKGDKKEHDKGDEKEHDKGVEKDHDKECEKDHNKEHENDDGKEHEKDDDQHMHSESKSKKSFVEEPTVGETDQSHAMEVSNETSDSNEANNAASFMHDLSDIPTPIDKFPG